MKIDRPTEVVIDGEVVRRTPKYHGFGAISGKGDEPFLAELHDAALGGETSDLILAEAKGGTGKLGGIWRTAANGEREFLRQMGSDGKWVRNALRNMKKSKHLDDVKMAEMLEEALKKGTVGGIVVSTPIKDTVIQETKVVKVLFE